MNFTVRRCLVLLGILAFFLHPFEVFAQDDLRDTSLSLKLSQIYGELPFDFSTTASLRHGLRFADGDDLNRTHSLSELRFQINSTYYSSDWSEVVLRTDVGYDAAYKEAILDIRNLYVDIYPQTWWSMRLGRQIITWGKGDLVFINDLFPKDYPSFLLGRDIQYLKAPNDAIKMTLNPSWLQMNVVYVPIFDPDRYVTGERVSFFDPLIDGFRGESSLIDVREERDLFKDDEWHVRLQKNIRGVDAAVYYYHGFWKSPRTYDPSAGQFLSTGLDVWGASVDLKLLGGVLATEVGYYHGTDDTGADPLTPNDEVRWLVNYTRDFGGSLSLSAQYYSEHMRDYDAFLATWPATAVLPGINDFVNFRVRKLASKQRLELSLFSFLSLRNKDFYIRPAVSYKLDDYWKISTGANVFGGAEVFTPWSQFRNNTAAYMAIQWTI